MQEILLITNAVMSTKIVTLSHDCITITFTELRIYRPFHKGSCLIQGHTFLLQVSSSALCLKNSRSARIVFVEIDKKNLRFSLLYPGTSYTYSYITYNIDMYVGILGYNSYQIELRAAEICSVFVEMPQENFLRATLVKFFFSQDFSCCFPVSTLFTLTILSLSSLFLLRFQLQHYFLLHFNLIFSL